MNFLFAAILFFLAWWFADQGLYFFAMLFVIVLVMAAIAEGNKPPRPAAVMQVQVQSPAAAAAATAQSTKWDDSRIESFGRSLAKIVLIPFQIAWAIVKWIIKMKSED